MTDRIRYITNDDKVIVGFTKDPGFGIHGIPYHGMGVYSRIVEEFSPSDPISSTDNEGNVTRLFKDVDGVKTARTEQEKTDDPAGEALHLKNIEIAKIKSQAQESICMVRCDWKQRNDLYDMVMLLKKVVVDSESLTADDLTVISDIISRAEQIKTIRADSDAAEAAL